MGGAGRAAVKRVVGGAARRAKVAAAAVAGTGASRTSRHTQSSLPCYSRRTHRHLYAAASEAAGGADRRHYWHCWWAHVTLRLLAVGGVWVRVGEGQDEAGYKGDAVASGCLEARSRQRRESHVEWM